MKHNKKKLLIILAELMHLFLKLGCTNITINFDVEDDYGTVKIKGNYAKEKKKHLEKLEKSLGCGRNEEMEECYWSISGGSETDNNSELYVVGSMLDKCTVTYDDEFLEVLGYRKFNL